MDHLTDAPPPLSTSAGLALAAKLHVAPTPTAPADFHCLAKLAKVLEANPHLVNPELPTKDATAYYQTVYDHLGAFALTLEDLQEPARVTPFQINTFGPPASRPPIRTPPAHAAFITKEISELKKVGLVVSQPTPWAAPCFAVPKPRSEKLRLVTDYRPLNAQTVRDSHPIPHVKDVLAKVGQWTHWVKLDLKSGFW